MTRSFCCYALLQYFSVSLAEEIIFQNGRIIQGAIYANSVETGKEVIKNERI